METKPNSGLFNIIGLLLLFLTIPCLGLLCWNILALICLFFVMITPMIIIAGLANINPFELFGIEAARFVLLFIVCLVCLSLYESGKNKKNIGCYITGLVIVIFSYIIYYNLFRKALLPNGIFF